MKENPQNKKVMLSIIGVAILVVLLVGITYAFFNYTRTGTQNIIKTGRIYFNSEQGTAMNLDNLFPIDTTENGIMNDATKVGTVTINIVGDTTYENGVEYLVSAVNVQNTVGSGQNAKSLPISIDVSVANNTNNDPVTNLGTASENYYSDRGHSTSYYKVLATDVIENNEQLLVGYITPGSKGVNGNIVIKAYIDKEKVAISDTYDPDDYYYTLNKNMTNEEMSACVEYFEELHSNNVEPYWSWYIEYTHPENNDGPMAFCQNVQDYYHTSFETILSKESSSNFTQEQLEYLLNENIIIGHNGDSNGTTTDWVNERTVFTTTEWNSLQQNGVSFQVKVEANEGIWVYDPDYIESTPGVCFKVNSYNPDFNNGNIISGFFGGLQEGETSTEQYGGAEYVLDWTYDERCQNTDVVIPSQINGVTIDLIGYTAFNGSYTNLPLTSVVLPNNLVTIGESAFSYNNLTEVNIPNGVTEIYDYAFESNDLRNVVIPNSVTKMGHSVFSWNGNLESITFEGKNCTQVLNTYSSYNTSTNQLENGVLSSWQDYASSDYEGWSETAKIIDGSGNICYDPNA